MQSAGRIENSLCFTHANRQRVEETGGNLHGVVDGRDAEVAERIELRPSADAARALPAIKWRSSRSKRRKAARVEFDVDDVVALIRIDIGVQTVGELR